MSEHEGDVVLGTEIGKPVPTEDALGGDDEVVSVGLDGLEEGIGPTRLAFVQKNGPFVIDETEVHGPCVEIDAAVVAVLSAIEAHEVPPG